VRYPDLPQSPALLVAQWPRGLNILEAVPFRPTYDAGALLAACRWAGLSAPGKLRRSGVSYRAVTGLAKIAARNRHRAQYHHSGHIFHVIMACGVLAYADGLSQHDTDLLIIAGLVHDLDHQASIRSSKLYAPEMRSADIARAWLTRFGGDVRIAERVTDLLLATSFPNDAIRTEILGSDPLAAYLVDADIFASCFYRRAFALRLSGHIKHEDRLLQTPTELGKAFRKIIRDRGFSSDVAVDLHAALSLGHSAFHEESR